MLRQRRLVNLPLVGVILLGVLVGVYLAAWKRFSKPAPSGRVVKHPVETPADDVLKYWTPDKMRNARPAPMPNVTAPGRGKRRRRRSPDLSRPRQA